MGSLLHEAKLKNVLRPALSSLPILDLWGHLCAALLSSRTLSFEKLLAIPYFVPVTLLYSILYLFVSSLIRRALQKVEHSASDYLSFGGLTSFLSLSFFRGFHSPPIVRDRMLMCIFSLSHFMTALSEASFLVYPAGARAAY